MGMKMLDAAAIPTPSALASGLDIESNDTMEVAKVGKRTRGPDCDELLS